MAAPCNKMVQQGEVDEEDEEEKEDKVTEVKGKRRETMKSVRRRR